MPKVKTTGEAGGLHWPYKGHYQPHRKGASNIFLLHEMLRRY